MEVLSEDQRLAVIMRYFGAMSIQDIAWATRVPIGTVKSRLHAAMSKIKGHLSHHVKETEDEK